MPSSDMLPIGTFARRCGLTPSALRFYDDLGVLRPAEVDRFTGYRYYTANQVHRAIMVRQLREIGMPLASIDVVLDADPAQASRLIDDQVAEAVRHAGDVQRAAASIKSSLGGEPRFPIAEVPGPMMADTIEQILVATAHEPEVPVLGGVHVEKSPEALSLTATDRYRLSMRTLVPGEPSTATWSGTVDGNQLRAMAPAIRRKPLLRLEASSHGLWFRSGDSHDRLCGLLEEAFPDYRAMLASLHAVTTRATIDRSRLLLALERLADAQLVLAVTEASATVSSANGGGPGVAIPAATTGPDVRIWFELTTLYPAVSTAVGPDVMLEARGPDQPVTIRSADHGDLTTLAMPIEPDHVR